MTESFHVRDLLLPELEAESGITRRMLAAVPDHQEAYKPHEKSMTLASLAGHIAEMPDFAIMVLTGPDMDLAIPNSYTPYKHASTQQTLAHFNQLADKLLTTVNKTTDETFNQSWSLVYGDHPIFAGSRYNAYRTMCLNHLVHHRAQLGVYLRLLGVPVPGSYGPSADER